MYSGFPYGVRVAGEAAPPGQVLVRLPGRCTVWVDMNGRSGYSRATIIAHDVQACLPPGENFLKVPETLIFYGVFGIVVLRITLFELSSFCG